MKILDNNNQDLMSGPEEEDRPQELSTFKSVLNISVDNEYARTSKTGEKRVISYPSILAN